MTKTFKRVASKRVIESGGNVFADLGLPNAEQELETAKALGIKRPHVSLFMRNRAGSFSVGLREFLTALGHDVQVGVRRRSRIDSPSR